MDNEKIVWNFPNQSVNGQFDFSNKDSITDFLVNKMFMYTINMFDWKGLPPTIPKNVLEFQIQNNGYTGIVKYKDKLFSCWGQAGAILNYNYMPSRFIVANPYLFENSSRIYKIYYTKDDYENPLYSNSPYEGECVVIQNDILYTGLKDINRFYASQLTENVITKRLVTILSRATNIYLAEDDDDKQDFDDFMEELVKGNFSAVIAQDIIKKLKTMPLSEKGHEALTNLIEDHQYIKASWLNDLGLQANYNMKRESINSNESQLNKDAILPFVDSMLECRKQACKRVNELYGVNWSVEFSSAWKYTRDTIEQAIEAIDETTKMSEHSDKKDTNNEGDENDLD